MAIGKSIKNNLKGNLESIRNQLKDTEEGRIEELKRLKEEFASLESKFYGLVTGKEVSSYEEFQDTVLNRFKEHSAFYEDIQKIAVRLSVDEQGMSELRLAHSLSKKDKSLPEVTIKEDELITIVNSIFGIKDPNLTKVGISDKELMGEKEWGDILKDKFSVKKRGTKTGGFAFDKDMEETVRDVVKAYTLKDVLDEDSIKESFLPIYQKAFTKVFCDQLKIKLDALSGISARKKKDTEKTEGKTVISQGLLDAIKEAREEAVAAVDYHFNGKEPRVGLSLIELSVEEFGDPIEGLFTVLDGGFSKQVEKTLRDKLDMILTKKIDERDKHLRAGNSKGAELLTSQQLTADWVIDTFQFKSEEAKVAVRSAFANTQLGYFQSKSPAQIIGDLSEVLYSTFFQLVLSGNQTIEIKSLGGAAKTYDDEEIGKLEPATRAWKQGKQPATDLLINGVYGFQVKNAFSRDALTDHGINFISQKTIETLFLTEFLDIKIPLLPEYTAQAIYYLIDSGMSNTDFELWPILNEIYSFFVAEILDLGEYAEGFRKDKNIFYLYLSQYIIPASEIIGQVISFLEKQEGAKQAVHLLPKIDKKQKNLINIKRDQKDFEPDQNKNLVSNMKMGAKYTFYDSFIKGFDILLSNIQQEQK